MTKIFRVTPGNFGDDLNEVLIEQRLGKDFEGNVFLNFVRDYSVSNNDTLIVAIGTILNELVPKQGKKVILGAGTGYGEFPVVDDSWDIKFVRGPLTAKVLHLADSASITDPGILIAQQPVVFPDRREAIGYMPHHAVANSLWEKVCDTMGLTYIDPRKSYSEVMAGILSCQLILTEAMHGAIVADALRIPWIPISTAKKVNQFKWNDWCASLAMDYNPSFLTSLWPTDESNRSKSLMNKIKIYNVKSQIHKILKNTQPVLSSDAVFRSRLQQVADLYDAYFSQTSTQDVA